MTPERSCTVTDDYGISRRIEEFYWGGKRFAYIDNRLSHLSYDEAVMRFSSHNNRLEVNRMPFAWIDSESVPGYYANAKNQLYLLQVMKRKWIKRLAIAGFLIMAGIALKAAGVL